MHLTRTHPKDLARLSGNAGKYLGRILHVEPVRCPSQTIVVEIRCLNARPQQVLHLALLGPPYEKIYKSSWWVFEMRAAYKQF
jgi:hypothetical protein